MVEVPVAGLVPGDRVILRPGARVPVDGRVADGAGHLDESTVTGNSAPVRKAASIRVHEATVNPDGILTVEVTRGLETSTVAQMIKLVTEAQAMKSPSERFSDWVRPALHDCGLRGLDLVLVRLSLSGSCAG